MPRRSSASVAMTPFGHGVNATMTRLPPPTDLDPAATVIWRRIIAGSDPQHFVAADTELLRSYCESSVLAQEAYREMQVSGRIVDGKVSAWAILHEKATRAMALLAPKLRIGPSTRIHPHTAAKRQDGLIPSIYDRLDIDAEQ